MLRKCLPIINLSLNTKLEMFNKSLEYKKEYLYLKYLKLLKKILFIKRIYYVQFNPVIIFKLLSEVV